MLSSKESAHNWTRTQPHGMSGHLGDFPCELCPPLHYPPRPLLNRPLLGLAKFHCPHRFLESQILPSQGPQTLKDKV